MREEEYIKKHLPDNHNQQDIIYIKARYAWHYSKKGDDSMKLLEEAMDAYAGTTFQHKHYPKKELKYDRQRQTQLSLFQD
ncbi:hypothetical protein FAZ19_16165 [Sphingobacterium alkalisoli]|uniref:Uncharacterized protein n=1 Tax=Sphingobacterium alkalisoli TaxID=1874115 RepID=A0A4U0GX96_9SPHI|nr:hypothetical protein [Sphingobacterium alkalisoli]TJY63801.1 hypothetical protein FAZ19_16165 [Sphingobacterium alkalisoli]GGH24803.1 hypothetical protein GCM10011418_32970 [Sphingobacterium alkalisoli]